jgi:D-3-phosphoglycerate dehydrogenase
MLNKSRGDIAYTLIDVNAAVPGSVVEQFDAIEGILNIRVIA